MDAVINGTLFVWLLMCLVSDLRFQKLPNYLMLAGGFVALMSVLIVGKSASGATVSSALMAMLIALLITLPAYGLKLLGAGDVKMLAVLGLMTGLQFMLLSFVIAGMLSGCVLLYSVVSRRYVPFLNLHLAKIGWQLPPTTIFNGKSLPFGALLAFGGLLVLAFHITGMMNAVAVP